MQNARSYPAIISPATARSSAPPALSIPSDGSPRVPAPCRRGNIREPTANPASVDRSRSALPSPTPVCARLRINRLHVKIPPTGEHPRIKQLILAVFPRPPPVFRAQPRIRRRRIEIKITLLHVLAVISLAPRQPKHPLLQIRIAPIPQCQREAQPTLAARDPEQPVFAPAISTRPRLRLLARASLRRATPSWSRLSSLSSPPASPQKSIQCIPALTRAEFLEHRCRHPILLQRCRQLRRHLLN
jgi:hypothetical protein